MKKITVFGSFVVDLTSWAERLPTAGETIWGQNFKLGPGGKGSNQAVAAHRLGADISLVTKVGRDVFGQVALDFYRQEQMDTSHIFIDDAHETGAALIMVDRHTGQNQIVVTSGACAHITDVDINRIRPLLQASDIILLQLETNLDANERVIEIARAAGKMVVINTAPARELPDEILARCDIITPNEFEASVLSGVKVASMADAEAAACILMQRGVKNVLITMGEQGVFVKTPERQAVIPAYRVKAVDATGAGDAFNGGFVTALAEDRDIFEAARFGNAVAALSVTKYGTAPAMPFRADVDEMLRNV